MTKRLLGLLGMVACCVASAEPPEIRSVRPAFSPEQIAAFRSDNRGGNRPQNRDRNREDRRRDWRRGGRNRPPIEVGMYDKLELVADVRATFSNPFDPEDVELWAEFTSPAGKVQKIWGFYNPSQFGAAWMVRFAPGEIGTWKYVLHVRDREGTAVSESGEFRCVESRHAGFITVAPNKRYLRYTDGSSFYGVGLWYNDGFGGFRGGDITAENLDGLGDRGVNFISFFHEPLETMATGLGRYDLNRCNRLDQIFQWCEERDLAISWNLWFHIFLSETVWEGARWDSNPYRTITPAKDFFASEEAWKYQQKLFRYIIARWGYSRSLFLWFTIDEINGTDGWVHGDQAAALVWCRRMNDFFHTHDPYGRPTTGTKSGGVDDYWTDGYRIFDLPGREIYEAQGHPMPPGGKPDLINKNPLQFSYKNYAEQTQRLWSEFEKPAIIAESGWDHTYYEPGMPGYLALYHNALWASLANGACASPFWWAYSGRVNDSLLTGQLEAFAEFVEEIDFAGAEWTPAEVQISTGNAYGLKSPELLFGWAANPMSGVAKETVTVRGLEDGDYEVALYHTWRTRDAWLEEIDATARNGSLSFTVPELVPEVGHGNHIGDDVAFTIVKRTSEQRELAGQ